MKKRAFNLLKSWCDRLLEHQIKEIKDKSLFGAVVCPACAFVHGRCADALYPLIYLYSETKNKKYFDSAVLLVDWAENNVLRKDGSYDNDVTKKWKCTTSFFQIGMGETLIHFKDIIDETTYRKWFNIFKRQSEFMINYLGNANVDPHINYYCAWAHSMAMAYKILGDEKYRIKAKHWLNFSLSFITDDYLLCGEGHPIDLKTDRGRRAIDLGYNVEESVPALCECAMILGDKKALSRLKKCVLAHIEFMLPDGGWDNSFGTRIGKWTYYGSRTSDGCQSAFLDFDDDIIREAAYRNFLQYEKCTFDGELYGGPMYHTAGEKACYHHMICHAKSLVKICMENEKLSNGEKPKEVKLLREEEYGVKRFNSAGVLLVSKGKWRATICDNDFDCYGASNPMGACITMLYHMDAGVVLAASMTKYKILEPGNFQVLRNSDEHKCSTFRIENGEYLSILDKDAKIDENLNASGSLVNRCGEKNGRFEIKYEFSKDVAITVKTDVDAVLVIPCANLKKTGILCEEKEISVGKEYLSLPNGFIFNDVKINLEKNEQTTVKISVK